ncbi:MAG: sugar-binding protein, partial [Chryseobacterium sp.]
LAFVISPKADQQITSGNNTVTTQILDDLCYQYVYDNKFRLVEKKLPGKGWEYMVYDLQNRLVASQDANMRNTPENPNTWLFTRYDKLGRVVYTGQFTGGTRWQEQNNANAKGLNNESRSTTAFTLNGQEIFYTNTAYPSATFVPYSINYYDTYPVGNRDFTFYPLNTEVLTFYMTNTTQSFSSNGVNSVRSLKSMPTSSFVKNLDDDSWSASHIWYDALLRPVGSKNVNHLGGYTNTEKELDFSGAVLRANTFHKKTSANTETVIRERFNYDDHYRVKKHYHQVNGNNEELLAEYAYNELGQVSKKTVGNGIQDIDYTYDIKGTVTKVNDPSNLNGKLFGYELKFASTSDAAVAPANYNGNITEMIW